MKGNKACKNCSYYYFISVRIKTHKSISTTYFCDPLSVNTQENYSEDNLEQCHILNKNKNCKWFKRKKWWEYLKIYYTWK